jgi:hypothetical protein
MKHSYTEHFSSSFVVSEISEELRPYVYISEFLYSTINKASWSHLTLGLNVVSVICASFPSSLWIIWNTVEYKNDLPFRHVYKKCKSIITIFCQQKVFHPWYANLLLDYWILDLFYQQIVVMIGSQHVCISTAHYIHCSPFMLYKVKHQSIGHILYLEKKVNLSLCLTN